jgi:hypothetical protein
MTQQAADVSWETWQTLEPLLDTAADDPHS